MMYNNDCGFYIGNTGKLYVSPTKRIKNIYHLVYDYQNLITAQYNAQKGKGNRQEVYKFNQNIIDYLTELHEQLRYATYKPGEYKIKTIHEPKERTIMISPFFHYCVSSFSFCAFTHIMQKAGRFIAYF